MAGAVKSIAGSILSACVGLAGCDPHVSGGARSPVELETRLAQQGLEDTSVAVDAEGVREMLKLEARPMMEALNDLGARRVQAAGVRILVAAWLGERAKEPALNWDEMDRTDVRFALANELVRAHINGFSDIPVASLAAFARPYLLDDHDEGTLVRAIYLTVLAGNADDIERVKALVLKTSSQTTFRAGVSALASVCAPEAATALDEIRGRLQSDVYLAILDEVRRKSAPFRVRRCKG